MNIEVLFNLSISDIIQLSLVCKEFNILSKSEILWKKLCYLHPNFHLFKITKSWYETYVLNYNSYLIEINLNYIIYRLKGSGELDYCMINDPTTIYPFIMYHSYNLPTTRLKLINIIKHKRTMVLVTEYNMLYKVKCYNNRLSVHIMSGISRNFLGRNVAYSITNKYVFAYVIETQEHNYLYVIDSRIITFSVDICNINSNIIDAWEIDGMLYIKYEDDKLISTSRYA